MNRKIFWKITESAFHKWLDNHASLRAASLAYFIILPLPSLFLIILLILSLFYGQTNSFQTLIQQINTIVGPTITNLIQQILDTVTTPFNSIVTSIITILFALMGALGAFSVLQNTMNEIWEAPKPKLNSKQKLKHKIIPFILISVLGLITIVWTGFTTSIIDLISILLPLASNTILIFVEIVQFILSLVLVTLLFMIIYKFIPGLPIKWKDVRLAAIFTGLIFTIAKYLIAVIFEVFTVTSVTGAAGAIMILLLWIYLCTQLIFYGAAFSKVYSEEIGSYSEIKTKSNE
ncbi:MAG: YihY/virulence factor BrkB family protein [Asgard group archaeon]|nr:YihY/virulence factor BrkB family protein [Asgard group archaeon]